MIDRPTSQLASCIFVLLAFFLSLSCTEDSQPPVNQPEPATGIVFKDVQTHLQIPSQVQFTFRVSDNRNHAILIDLGELPKPFRIFEDNEEIDYTETSYFVHPAASLELDMLVLLDFTNSMASWHDTGETAIDLEVAWVRELIDGLAETHRMAIMEHHDRNLNAGVIAGFTSDKSSLHASLDAFLSHQIDYGSSRIWDALLQGVVMFEGSPDENKQRTVLFVTDGKETSSKNDPSDIISRANEWHVNVFVIGAGAVSNEATLENIGAKTGGEYYSAADIATFNQKLAQIKADLGGQYKLSYLTLRSTGTHNVKVTLDYDNLTGSFDTTLDLGSIYGDDRIGVLTFDEPSLSTNELKVVVRAQHVPRNINRLRFKLETEKLYSLRLIPASAGGLCSDWSIAGPDEQGYLEIMSEIPLKFGDFGPLFELTIQGVIESSIAVPFLLDNSIYAEGKSFTAPAEISFATSGP